MKDTYEILSYAAEAWGKPLGIVPSANGFTDNVDLNALVQYNALHYSHSRQFRSNIVAEWKYWEKVLGKCGLGKSSED